jgi:hypothetical protein
MPLRFWVAAFLIAFVCRTVPAHAEAIGADVVIIIDTSGSMERTDPNRKVLESAVMLIDMMAGTPSRVGIVEFSGFVEYTAALTPLSDTEAIEEIKQQISRFRYFGYTDIGLALRTGAEILLASHTPPHNPMIMLFTDGVTEIGPRQAQQGRTVALSHNDILWALGQLDGHVPIHTIGLNQQDSVDVALLTMIAGHSTATATFTRDADSLPEIFAEIYRNHISAAEIIPDTEKPEAWEEAPEETFAPPPLLPVEAPERPEEIATNELPIEEPAQHEAPGPQPLNRYFLIGILIFVVAVVAINLRWLLGIIRSRPSAGIKGCLDIVTFSRDGARLPMVSVELDFDGGRMDLSGINDALSGAYLTASRGLALRNKSDCEITDAFDTVLTRRKIKWDEGAKFTFTEKNAEDLLKIEITYNPIIK